MAKGLARVLSGIGFFVGIAVIVVAADLALGLNFINAYFSAPSTDALVARNSYLGYFLPVMLVLGVLLVARPIRNIRWASLIGLGAGLIVSYYAKLLLPGISSTILIIVFLVATVAIYTVLRFVEDILEFIGQVLAFPPVAVIIGLVSLYFGVVIATSFP
jgi:hypothetical protein